MNEKVFAWGDNRRYYSGALHAKKIFGERIQKVSIDAGFTCPNRDGTVASGGCTYCNNKSFTPSYCNTKTGITGQIDKGIAMLTKRYCADKYLAYFQSYSNTYAPIEHLERLYNEALAHPSVIGIVIGTRADCVDEEKLDYLKELSKRTYIKIEYGIESCYDKTLAAINRGHDFNTVIKALELTAAKGIPAGGHLIMGLPGESREEMVAGASIISSLPLESIKLHQLQIIKGTAMAVQYRKDPSYFNLFGLAEYMNLVADFLELLSPRIAVERMFAEAVSSIREVPSWGSYRNADLISLLELELEQRNSWQGKHFKG